MHSICIIYIYIFLNIFEYFFFCFSQISFDNFLPLLTVTDVQIGRIIGKGNFGSVFDGLWKGAQVALKTIPEENVHEILQEASVLQ